MVRARGRAGSRRRGGGRSVRGANAAGMKAAGKEAWVRSGRGGRAKREPRVQLLLPDPKRAARCDPAPPPTGVWDLRRLGRALGGGVAGAAVHVGAGRAVERAAGLRGLPLRVGLLLGGGAAAGRCVEGRAPRAARPRAAGGSRTAAVECGMPWLSAPKCARGERAVRKGHELDVFDTGCPLCCCAPGVAGATLSRPSPAASLPKGRPAYYAVWGYGCVCMGVFMVRTMKRVIFQEARQYSERPRSGDSPAQPARPPSAARGAARFRPASLPPARPVPTRPPARTLSTSPSNPDRHNPPSHPSP